MVKCLFVYNPKSGKSGIVKRINYIEEQLKTIYDKVDIIQTQYRGHATQIAKDACGKYNYLIISGGDGSVNEIINGLAEQENRPILGYLPSGTVNDISRSLKISRNLNRALNILRDNNVFSHDIFKSNDKYGMYFCGGGCFTSASYTTNQKSKKLLGKIAYFFDGVKELGDIADFNVKITNKDGKIVANDKYILMLILNSRSVAGFKLNASANLSDGKVDIILIKRPNNKWYNYWGSLSAIATIFLFDIKRLGKSKRVTKLQLDEFNLQNSKRLIINVDGEKSSYGNMNFKVINKGIDIITPSKFIKLQFDINNKNIIDEQKQNEKLLRRKNKLAAKKKKKKKKTNS